MSEDSRIQPLLEWNRLARENTENAIVSSMFQAASCAIEPVEKFSTWLLAGAAAIASFLITNSDKIVPYLGKNGFLVCGGFLCLSCFFGLLAKLAALRSQIASQTNSAVQKKHLKSIWLRTRTKNEKFRMGQNSGALICKQVSVLSTFSPRFLEPLPWWVKLLVNWKLKNQMSNPQVGNLPLIKNLTWLGYFTAGQSLSVLAFFVSGFLYAAAI